MERFLENQRYQFFLFIYVGLLVFLGRQVYGLPNFDDCYYAEKAKELLESGDLWTMYFNGTPTFDNVPLPMWMTAISYKIFGVSTLSSLLFPSLFSILTILLTCKVAMLLFNDKWTAFLAGFILIFPGYYFDYSRRGMVDTTLTFFVVSSLYAFLKGVKSPKFFILFGILFSFAILTKSILGLFPVFITVGYLIFTRQFRILFSAYYLGGVLLGISLSSTWYLINFARYGNQFMETHFGWLILKRALNDTAQGQDMFFFLGYLTDLFGRHWPWVPIVFIGFFLGFKEVFKNKTHGMIFILSWIWIIIVIMSTSRAQQARYILSAYPGMAILTAYTIGGWIRKRSTRLKVLRYMIFTVLLLPLFITSTNFQIKSSVMLSENEPELRYLARFINLNVEEGSQISNYRMPTWSPRNLVMFYANRFLTDTISESENLMESLSGTRSSTALAFREDFNEITGEFKERFTIIVASEKYVFFTLKENQKNISYDISGITLPR